MFRGRKLQFVKMLSYGLTVIGFVKNRFQDDSCTRFQTPGLWWKKHQERQENVTGSEWETKHNHESSDNGNNEQRGDDNNKYCEDNDENDM